VNFCETTRCNDQKTVIFTLPAVRTWNITMWEAIPCQLNPITVVVKFQSQDMVHWLVIRVQKLEQWPKCESNFSEVRFVIEWVYVVVSCSSTNVRNMARVTRLLNCNYRQTVLLAERLWFPLATQIFLLQISWSPLVHCWQHYVPMATVNIISCFLWSRGRLRDFIRHSLSVQSYVAVALHYAWAPMEFHFA
jgi:hypothetical protein